MKERWVSRFLSEVIGTFVLVLFGCAAVIIAVHFGPASDLFSAGLAWGFAVALAIYVAGSLSGRTSTRR
jgi:glycerol uptake facilitator-like aquaporin